MRIAEVWRNPVKTIAGERLSRAHVGPLGICGLIPRSATVPKYDRGLAPGSRKISRVEKENVSSPKQGFIAIPGSSDVHVRIPQIFPAIPWMV